MDRENLLSGFLIIYIAMCLSKPKKLRGYKNISIDTKYWEFLSFLSLPNIQINTFFSPHEYKDYFLELILHKSRMKFYSSCFNIQNILCDCLTFKFDTPILENAQRPQNLQNINIKSQIFRKKYIYMK